MTPVANPQRHALDAHQRRRFSCLVLLVAGVTTASCGPLTSRSGSDGRPVGELHAAPQSARAAANEPAVAPATRRRSAVDQTIDTLSRHVERMPRDPNAWAALGNAFMQKARDTLDAGYYGHAQRAFAQSLTHDARNVDALIGMAWVHGCRHEFEASIEWANEALALDANNAAARGLIGDAYVELGNYEGARAQYQQMLAIRPDLSSFSRAAHLLHLTGDTRGAIRLMRRAIESGGPYAENTAWCRAQLALIHLDTGNLLAADGVLQEAIAAAPDNYHVLFARGRVQAARRDFAAAIQSYRQAAAIAPQHEVVVALGDVYRAAGRESAAEEQYALVEAIHSVHQQNGIRGDLQLAQFSCDHDRDLPEALRIADEEYQSRKNVFAADTVAWCAFKNGRSETAQRYIARALSERTPSAVIRYHAGMIHAAAGKRALAQRYLYQALSLNPAFDPIAAPLAADTLARLGSATVTR